MYGREDATSPRSLGALAPGLVAGLAVAALAADGGGYDPTTWGWSALALLIVAVGCLIVGSRRLAPLEWAFPAALAALGGWVWLSLAWSSDFAQTVEEGERMLVYVAGAGGLLLLGRRSRVDLLVASLGTAITAVCAYALATRLLTPGRGSYQVLSPDPQASFRLARPLGYANALAIFAVLGMLLVLGFALRGRTLLARALGSAALVVLAPTLYFTYGRGAWLALAAGLVALLALERDRLGVLVKMIALGVAPAIAVLLASTTHALTSQPGAVAAARHDGHLLAVATVLLAAAAALVPIGLDRLEARVALGPSSRRALVFAVVLAGAVVVLAGLVRVGGPGHAIRRAYHAFNAPAPLVKTNESRRLFSLSGSSRSEYWRVAWREFEAHPWLGAGAGSFQRFWLRHRREALPVLDAHSLYLETLAELGPFGLLLLLCALAVPLGAVRAARRHPLASATLGAYVAFLVHAGIDWDWEMPAVTLAALACGVALLLSARGAETAPLIRTSRSLGVALAALLGVVAIVGYVGNQSAASASDALDAEHLSAVTSDAERARRWEPWSAEPWRLLGEAQLQAGEVERAQASFLRGLRKDDRDWELWLDLALASRGSERQHAIGRVAELNPLSSELRDLRGSR
ncbi:MAG TPA: O-antigen ligase family protein [Gaiellaceae bacterium]|nr:O-antigen ligase family protein [Gaiellaceae bacterium]